MSDNELDNLFKEAAEGFTAPHDPSAWKNMSNKLDQAGVGTSVFWNWKTISTIAVVGVTSVVVVWYASQKDTSQPVTQENSTSQPIESTEPKPVQPSLAKETEANSPLLPQKSQSDFTANQAINQKASNENSPASRIGVNTERGKNFIPSQKTEKETSLRGKNNRNLPTEQEDNSALSTENQTTSSTSTAIRIAEARADQNLQLLNDSEKQKEVGGTNQASYKTIVADKPTDKLGSNSKNQGQSASLAVADSLVTPTENLKASADSAQTEDKKESTEEKKKGRSAISLKLAVAPDFSSIKFFTPDKPGFNFGLLVGYSFSNRWSVYTGAISSRKIYSSKDIGKPYTTPSGYPYEVNKLDGDCRVLDIPINVYYTFFPDNSFSIKAGIGVSSYLMLSEDYTYYIDNPYGSDVYNQNVDHKNNEWLKVINVSMIIQKKLNNQFSLELEPFLKAPLTGVGEGEVSLVSLGAFFNLKFDIPINKP